MSALPSAESPVTNPFGPLVGQPLDDRGVDIEEINGEAFDACRRLVTDVAAGGYSSALTVFGDTGTGKTHLLGRVRRWLEGQPQTLFVFVRMETSAGGIWRHLRRRLAISLLAARPGDIRPLDRILGRARGELEALEHRDLSIVLEHLLEGRHARDCAAWLRGEGLPEEALSALRLALPGPNDDPEVISQHLVMALCHLIRPNAVIWCMDQIEAIRSSADDRDGPQAFGRAVCCLVEETRNSGVISCQQSSFMNMMAEILDAAAQSKVFARRAVIRPLDWGQAVRLIGARLDTVPDLAIQRRGQSPCWPLAESKIRDVFVDNAAPARKVISRCKDLFDLWSNRQTDSESQDEALQRELNARFSTKEPSETEAILRNGLPLLARAVGLACKVPGGRSPFNFLLDNGRVAIGICNEVDGRSITSRLKKISDAWNPAENPALLLMRDARTVIPRGANVGRQKLADIERKGGRLVTISQEALEALAALRRLYSDAESGDLAWRGDRVDPGTVEKWIGGHLPVALDPLVSGLGSAPAPVDRTAGLAELLAERKLVTLEDAARSLGVTTGEIEECARRDPRQFGLLGGSVPALFQPVAAGAR